MGVLSLVAQRRRPADSSIGRALAPEIRVNAVCPGLVTTRWFVQGVGQEGYERIKATD